MSVTPMPPRGYAMGQRFGADLPRPPIPGDFVKVSRFAEALWLQVLEIAPGDTFRCALGNEPICWFDADGVALHHGDAVIIGGREIVALVAPGDAR